MSNHSELGRPTRARLRVGVVFRIDKDLCVATFLKAV